MRAFFNFGLAVAVATGFALGGAQADTVTISYSENGHTFIPLTSHLNDAAYGPLHNLSGTDFNGNSIAGVGITTLGGPPDILGAGFLGLSTFGAQKRNSDRTPSATVWIAVTETDITAPQGPNKFTAYMTSLAVGDITGQFLGAYLDTSDEGLFTPADAIGTVSMASPLGTSVQSGIFDISGDYSVTALFEVTVGDKGGGIVADSINIIDAPVPGPIAGAGLPGLVAACGGLIALARRRRRKVA